MVKNEFLLISFIGFLMLNSTTYAQNNNTRSNEYICYRNAIDVGLKSFKRGDFGNAFLQFDAANACNYEAGKDSINLLIKEVVQALDKAREDALRDKKIAEEKTEQVIRLSKENIELIQKLRSSNERLSEAFFEVQKQKRRAESMLLSSLANNSRIEKRSDEALVMAFAGLQLAGKDTLIDGRRAFGDAVKDSLAKKIFESKTGIVDFQLLPEGRGSLILSGEKLYSFDIDGKANSSPMTLQEGSPLKAVLSENGERIATWSSGQKQIQFWDASGFSLGYSPILKNSVRFASFSKDSRYVLICPRDDSPILYDLQNINSQTKFNGSHKNSYDGQFSNDGKHLVTRSEKTVKIWDLNRNEIGTLGHNEIYIRDASFNAAGDKVLTASGNGLARIWDLKGNLLTELKGHESPVKEALFFSNDEKVLTRSVKTIKIWDLNGNSKTIEHSANISGVKLNHKGTAVLTWAVDKSLKLSDSEGNLIQDFKGLKSKLIAAEFSPDDQFIVTSGQDGSYLLWDREGNIIINWDNTNKTPVPARFTKDGQFILTIEQNNTKLMRCPLPKLAYKEMEKNIHLFSDDIKKLKRKYKLEFLDEITQ